MKHVICSVYDSATEAYMRPFTAQTVGQAVRMFEDEVRAEGNPLSAHPEDYSLFQIGTFNDNTAEMENVVKCLRRAHEVGRTE